MPGHVQSFTEEMPCFGGPREGDTPMLWRVCPCWGRGVCVCLIWRKNRYLKQLWLSEFSCLYSPTVPKMLITSSETFRGCYSQISVSGTNRFHECLFHLPFSLCFSLPVSPGSVQFWKENTKLLQLWELLYVAPGPLVWCSTVASLEMPL